MRKNCPGFSLIELLVSISVVAILSGIGLAAFSTFSRRQIVASATRQLLSDLRLAQSKADSNEKTVDCEDADPDEDLLLGYKVEVNSTDKQYQISPVCTSTPPPAPIKTVSFSPVITVGIVSNPLTITFRTMRQGVESVGFANSKVAISLSAYGVTRTVTVSQSGEIYTD